MCIYVASMTDGATGIQVSHIMSLSELYNCPQLKEILKILIPLMRYTYIYAYIYGCNTTN